MNFVLILDAAKCNCNEVFTAVSYFCHQKTKKKPDFGYCLEVIHFPCKCNNRFLKKQIRNEICW